MPTWLLRKHALSLLPVIMCIVNRSISEGMPQVYKKSIVKPLVKKGAQDVNSLQSYRPVSNMSFLAKLIEKVILSRLTEYLNKNSLYDNNQHGYRSHHSCETALLTVHNAAVTAIDEGNVMLLVMLDLSAAFDMINHDMLFSCLNSLGVCDEALKWIRNYLSNRFQQVSCENVLSEPSLQITGVPQGSVLGPLLFSVFLSKISSVFNRHPKIKYVIYADDIQLFISCSITEISAALVDLESCIRDTKEWLTNHHLILNASKTELIVFHSKHSKSFQPNNYSLMADGTVIKISETVRDLGVILDGNLQLNQHVNQVCKTAYYYLRLISRCRQFLTIHTTTMLVNALAISRIEYCGSLLYGLNAKCYKQINKVIKWGVRLAEGMKRRESTKTAMLRHKWLPSTYRTKLRLATIIHKAYYLQAPSQLASLIKFSTSSSRDSTLRSHNDNSLKMQRVRTKMGERSFSHAAPAVWNSLPTELRSVSAHSSFKQKLYEHYLTMPGSE